MCKDMRAVAAALVAVILGIGGALAEGPQESPFVGVSMPGVQKESRSVQRARVAKESAEKQIPAGERAETEKRIEQAFHKKTTLNYTEAELGEVIAQLSRDHDIPIQLDKEALEDMDLGSETLVTINVKDVSLRSALGLLLRPHDLKYIIRDEILLITSPEVAEENRTTIIYEVADLVTYRDEKGALWTDYQPLIDVLATTVEPESWMEMGGSGSILGVDLASARVLVVKTTEEIHADLASLLKAIREAASRAPGDGQPPLRSRLKHGPRSVTRPAAYLPMGLMRSGAPPSGPAVMGPMGPGGPGMIGSPGMGGTSPAGPAGHARPRPVSPAHDGGGVM